MEFKANHPKWMENVLNQRKKVNSWMIFFIPPQGSKLN
jgi:hypothetical protein